MKIIPLHQLKQGALFQVVNQRRPRGAQRDLPPAPGVWRNTCAAYSEEMRGHKHAEATGKTAIFGLFDQVVEVKG